ncbi:MAG: universal stress protein [Desulfobacterales bacterium]|nr:universal stress protein [Desulfobacterales bacterium]
MKKFKKILFPVDLSESSPKLVPYVLTMAEKFGAEIHMVFIARILDHFTGVYVPHTSIDVFEKEVVEGAKKRIQEFKEEHFQAYPDTKAVVLTGDISDKILAYIKSEGFDLVVMGTHGRMGLEKIVFGSVAERVAKMSPVPVLLVNPYKVS